MKTIFTQRQSRMQIVIEVVGYMVGAIIMTAICYLITIAFIAWRMS